MSGGVRLMTLSPFHLWALSRGLFLTRFKFREHQFDTVLTSQPAAAHVLPFRQIVWEASRAGQTLHYVSEVLAQDGAHRKLWHPDDIPRYDKLQCPPLPVSLVVRQPLRTWRILRAWLHFILLCSGSYTRWKRFISSHQICGLTQMNVMGHMITCVRYLMSHANMNCGWTSSSWHDRNSLWSTWHKAATGLTLSKNNKDN